MLHDVMTAATKGGDLVSARLPLYAGKKQVRAARIVALGMGSLPGQTRLALLGGAHVEVGKAWMQAQGARVGQYYVQGADGVNEAIDDEQFESTFSPVNEPEYDNLSDPNREAQQGGTGDDREQSFELAHKAQTAKVEQLEKDNAHLSEVAKTLTHERDGARKRITELEDQLEATRNELNLAKQALANVQGVDVQDDSKDSGEQKQTEEQQQQ